MVRACLIWGGVALVATLPLIAAGFSHLLQWRQPVYILAGFAGIAAFALLWVQPLLMLRALPGLAPAAARWAHRWMGAAVLSLIVLHVAGLWVTSPPDVVDALLLRSPTPFSLWGVIAMGAVFATAGLALLRRRMGPRRWRRIHGALAAVIVGGTIAHALLIDGTMEPLTKAALCLCAGSAAGAAIWRSIRP